MSLLNLQSPGFLNKKIHTLQIFKNSGWQAWLAFCSIYKAVSSFPRDPLYLYDFDLYKTQKIHKNTREDSLQNVVVISSVVWYAKTKFSRATFSDVVLKLLQISRKKMLGIHLRTTASVKQFRWMFPKVFI